MSIRSESPKSNGTLVDELLILKDAGAITSSAAAQVGGQAKILNIGTGKVEGELILDVTAIDIAGNDESYDLILQFSNSPTFASGIENGVSKNLGAVEVTKGGAQDSLVGRYKLPFTNVLNGVQYGYCRMYTAVNAASSSINYTAQLSIV